MSIEKKFTKENLDYYLNELAKEFKRRNGTKMSAEIILIGGASVLVNYGFRDMTYDIDAIITASSVMKEAINAVGDRLNLPNGWLNTEFKSTDSYSPKLAQYSKYYQTYFDILEVRTIQAEYLVAMKLVSGRRYKKDLSDIIGILNEQNKAGQPLSYDMIDKAVIDLYGNWDKISEYAIQLLQIALKQEDLSELFILQLQEEKKAEEIVLKINQMEQVTDNNVDDIIKMAMEKKKILEKFD